MCCYPKPTCFPKRSMSMSTGGREKMDAPAAVFPTNGAGVIVARANARVCACSCALSSTNSCLGMGGPDTHVDPGAHRHALFFLSHQQTHRVATCDNVCACTGVGIRKHACKSATEAATRTGSRTNHGAWWSSGTKLLGCNAFDDGIAAHSTGIM